MIKHVAHAGSDAFSTDKREGNVWKTDDFETHKMVGFEIQKETHTSMVWKSQSINSLYSEVLLRSLRKCAGKQIFSRA